MSEVEEILSVLENISEILNKAYINLKKCPSIRKTKGYIETRLKIVEGYWDTYRENHNKLVKIVPKAEKKELSYFTENEFYSVEENYLLLHAELRDILIQIEGCTSHTSSSPQVKLPKIELPIFTGVYDEWPTFQDLFLSLVHNNATLNKVQKLHYLKSSLKGEADLLLKNIQVTEANYDQAWEVLQNRYGNKRLIINSLLKKLFSQKKIPIQSAVHLKCLLDTTSECLKSMENLDISIDSWDPIIIFLVVQKLDPESHREWEEFAYKEDSEELPKWDDLVKFLQTKFRTLELVTPPTREKTFKGKEYTVHVATEENTKKVGRICNICKDNHTLCHCKDFIKMESPNRIEYVKSNNLCFNCLAPGHSARKCRLNMSCRVCHKRHHTLVHQSQAMTSSNQPGNMKAHHTNIEQEDGMSSAQPNVELSSHFAGNTATTLLATALVPVRDESGRTTLLRALIDHGSQATFISERAAQALKLKRTPANVTVTGFESTNTIVRYAAELQLLSKYDEEFQMNVKAYIVSTRLTAQLPSQPISANTWPHIQGLVLADPGFYQPGRIDMLLGVEVCAQIVKAEIIKGPPGTPCAQNTSLGWILFGQINDDKPRRDDFMVMHMNVDLNLDNMLKKMWELDTQETKAQTAEERKCEEIYQANYSRTNEGRYIVKLPTKTDKLICKEGETRDIAIKRLYQMEKRFEKDPNLKKEYVNVMQEYLTMNHMEEVPREEINNPAVYLPHHAVVKEEKETTKVRCVFNASQKGKNDVSLNDELLVGPQLQDDMRNLIMRWRMKQICFVADVQKMYRQILVTEQDKDLQRIVWRSNNDEPIKDYRLLRVTFGTASAPYLAVKTLHQIAEDEGKEYQDAVKIIKEDFFMDDLMSGKDKLQDAIKVAKEIDGMLQRGGFVLQKWCSNDADFLKHFEPSERSNHVKLDIKIDGTIRALGIQWNMGKDVFEYNLNLPSMTEDVTKRIILAEMQKLFDPLGWIAPCILPGKLLIQKLWILGLTWDEDVEETIKEQWLEIRKSFYDLNSIEVPRWLQTTEDDHVTIHGFCDASIKAYAAVAYMRVQTKNGEIKTGIIAAKTRVAPVKPVSLPRLELCGAVLLARLLKQIKNATRIPESNIFSWTDSTIVLSWLSGDPARWNTFVRNRVVEILDCIGHKWFHVQTQDNPADVASRGTFPAELKRDELWWKGPEWLRQEEIIFTKPGTLKTNLEQKENIQTNLKLNNMNLEENYLANQIENFDTLTELLKTITYCKRFLKGKKMEDKDKSITTEELNESLNTCIKIVQEESFKEDIEAIKRNKNVKKESKIKLLQPYLDEENILRVGGRLRHADIDENQKHPIILDGKDDLTALIVADAHLKTLHGGVQLMLGYLKRNYWILKAKGLVKRKIHKCLICARHNASARNQMMGDLPKVRITPARPFINSGVDFAGPYLVLASKGRGVKTNKAYISIFICMVTKAIHLELVGDLSTEAFIGAFRRFVARRGKCSHLWSDQGRNFVGANKELIATWQEAKLEFDGPIAETLALEGTQWHFIPAYSPHIGGLWESGVKSIKHHLKRTLNCHLTFEEMSTLLCQVEACLNSRPLWPIDDKDSSNMMALTPGHFLIGEAPITVPHPDLRHLPVNHLSRWQHIQKLLSDFWSRWQQEYLSRLQQRPKWLKKVEEFDIGQIVLIKNENLPPGKWALGRIVSKFPGADNVTRIYGVKSGDSIIQRTKLCPLPIEID